MSAVLDFLTVVFFALPTAFGLYFAIIALLGAFRRLPTSIPATKEHRFAVVVAARNEAAVIKPLVRSLKVQRYPAHLIDIYVAPNNCTDGTAACALAAGARILHIDDPVHSKGDVLKQAFAQLLDSAQAYDAFLVFDADNLVHDRFVEHANVALSNGLHVAQGYRDSKNPTDSWVSTCTSIFFWGMSRLYNHARVASGLSAALNGTGFMVSTAYVREFGWDTATLTEDLEFSAQCALNGVTIGWMESAIVYDEQPVTFRDSFVQRRRWSSGTTQCMRLYSIPLITCVVRRQSWQCMDMAVLFMGPLIQLVAFLSGARFFVTLVLPAMTTWGGTMWALRTSAIFIVGSFVLVTTFGYIICRLERRMNRKMIPGLLMTWLFIMSFIPTNLLGLLTKPPKWKHIPHVRALDVSDMPNPD